MFGVCHPYHHQTKAYSCKAPPELLMICSHNSSQRSHSLTRNLQGLKKSKILLCPIALAEY